MGDHLICPVCGGTPVLAVGPLDITCDPYDSDTVQWRARSTVRIEHHTPGGVRLECPLPLTEDERAAIREQHRCNDAALRAAVGRLARMAPADGGEYPPIPTRPRFEMGNG